MRRFGHGHKLRPGRASCAAGAGGRIDGIAGFPDSGLLDVVERPCNRLTRHSTGGGLVHALSGRPRVGIAEDARPGGRRCVAEQTTDRQHGNHLPSRAFHHFFSPDVGRLNDRAGTDRPDGHHLRCVAPPRSAVSILVIDQFAIVRYEAAYSKLDHPAERRV